MMKMVKLEKQGDSNQHGYVITNFVVKDTYLTVTEESLGRAVRFANMSEEVIIMSEEYLCLKSTYV